MNALPTTLFEAYDSLFLEIVADGNTISPRTLLTSTPSTRVANALEVRSGSDPAKVGIKTFPVFHNLEIFSWVDGGQDLSLGGRDYGEIWWLNGAPNHSITAQIGAYPGSGGALYLYDDFSAFQIGLALPHLNLHRCVAYF